MRESLASRVGRVISGGVNALVDAMEDVSPNAVLQESLREIDTVIADVRKELGTVIAHKHRASTRLMAENDRHEELSTKIDLAVSEGSEELARSAIEYQLDIEAQIPILEATIGECAKREAELERYIAALQARRREMKNELNALASRHEMSEVNGESATHSCVVERAESRVAKAEAVFSDVIERTSQLRSPTRPDTRTAAQLVELDELARKHQVSERLSAIKQGRV